MFFTCSTHSITSLVSDPNRTAHQPPSRLSGKFENAQPHHFAVPPLEAKVKRLTVKKQAGVETLTKLARESCGP